MSPDPVPVDLGPKPLKQADLPFGQQFFEKLFENLYDGVYFVDRHRRILFWNKGAELISGYTSAEVVGSYCYAQILDHTDRAGCHLCQAGCPLVASMSTGKPMAHRVFLKHKDNRRIAVDVHTMPVHDERGNIIGGVEVFRDATDAVALETAHEKLRELAEKDPLTGLANRRHLDRMLSYHLDMLNRTGIAFCVALGDIDHFKSINDVFGHPVGDQALIHVANAMSAVIRPMDILGRFGGEEFLLIVPGLSQEHAANLAERLRAAVGQSVPAELAERGITISLGVAAARPGDTAANLLARVDQALYRAKNTGRNRVEIAPPG